MRFRSHLSIVLWNANNEIDCSTALVMGAYAPDSNLEGISRDLLPRALRRIAVPLFHPLFQLP